MKTGIGLNKLPTSEGRDYTCQGLPEKYPRPITGIELKLSFWLCLGQLRALLVTGQKLEL